MGRMVMLLTGALVMAAIVLATAMPAFAGVKCTGTTITVCSGGGGGGAATSGGGNGGHSISDSETGAQSTSGGMGQGGLGFGSDGTEAAGGGSGGHCTFDGTNEQVCHGGGGDTFP
jgi:hypothetical protein